MSRLESLSSLLSELRASCFRVPVLKSAIRQPLGLKALDIVADSDSPTVAVAALGCTSESKY